MTNIDRVCQLIHELKEQDLSQHKKRIEERVGLHSVRTFIHEFARRKLVAK